MNEARVKTNNYCSVLSILIGLGQSLILPKEVRKASPEISLQVSSFFVSFYVNVVFPSTLQTVVLSLIVPSTTLHMYWACNKCL